MSIQVHTLFKVTCKVYAGERLQSTSIKGSRLRNHSIVVKVMKAKLQKEKHSEQSMEICNNNKENTTNKRNIHKNDTHRAADQKSEPNSLVRAILNSHIEKDIRSLELSLTRVPLLQDSILPSASSPFSLNCVF